MFRHLYGARVWVYQADAGLAPVARNLEGGVTRVDEEVVVLHDHSVARRLQRII